MTDFRLMLARPAAPAECLDEPLLSLLDTPAWVAYLTFGVLYLADVNDDPALESAYESGMERWTRCVPSLVATLARWSGGTAARIALAPPGGVEALIDKLSGREVASAWTVEAAPPIAPDLVESLSTYGWPPALWTALPPHAPFGPTHGTLPQAAVSRLIAHGAVAWWVSHGYKEPFLVGSTPALDLPALAALLGPAAGAPVELTDVPFVPHRVRQHRRGPS